MDKKDSKILESLRWRAAVKKFDPSRRVSEKDLQTLKESVRLAPSSYGLQPYKIFIIEDSKLREELKAASWGQSQITDSSNLFVFCNFLRVDSNQVDELIDLKAKVIQADSETLKPYGEIVKQKVAQKSDAEQKEWTARQVYIALSNLLIACGELQIDSCPIEGFSPAEYNRILDLEPAGLNAAVVTAVGYAEGNRNLALPKVRKSLEQLFEVR